MNRLLGANRTVRSAFGVVMVVALLVGCSGGSATPNPSPTQPPLLIDTNKLITWEITPGELFTKLLLLDPLQLQRPAVEEGHATVPRCPRCGRPR